MLDQRRRRWSDVVQILYKGFVFDGTHCPGKHDNLNRCWFNAGPVSQTVGQR